MGDQEGTSYLYDYSGALVARTFTGMAFHDAVISPTFGTPTYASGAYDFWAVPKLR